MGGRSVRCAACRETWFITPAEILAAQATKLGAVDEAEPDPVSDTAWEEAAAAVRTSAEDDGLPEPAIAPVARTRAARPAKRRRAVPAPVAGPRARAS